MLNVLAMLVYMNLYTHVLPKLKYLKIQDPIPKRTKANTSINKTKISQDQNPTWPTGAKGKSAWHTAAVTTPVASAFYFLPSLRHWPEPSLSNTSGPVLEAKKTRDSVTQFHASLASFLSCPPIVL